MTKALRYLYNLGVIILKAKGWHTGIIYLPVLQRLNMNKVVIVAPLMS